ncbi:MAG TPA: hypothetical protein VGV90_05400 [Solirubrobacteraceae bacterium]|nr:hypothetical protein [Solirubrobacteraceae bacterium]
MLSEQDIAGELCQYVEPNWQPLYDIAGVHLADWFMWMHEVELEDGHRAHAYKHIATRRYFHLGVDGRAFVYVPGARLSSPGTYREIDRLDAIDLVFLTWEELAPRPDEADRAALRRARHAAEHHQPLDSAG